MTLPPPPPLPTREREDEDLLTVATARPQPGLILVKAQGEIDLETSPALEAELNKVLHPPFPARLGLDLSEVTFISSSGLNLLAEVNRRSRACGTDMRLIGMSRPVQRALDLTGLDAVLKVHQTQLPTRVQGTLT
ncbi:STAS domain-containing protein [Amycolatopsis sp.]|jgi:anti-anti-sigma factor|uniref:STAS domain-containing protein n=1 Tax=Amycolatopsis sp. TaxID=37632 RepID=UPI002E060C1A|nr:STAS domain-containing protein [Amycolatopsis sp.]